MSSREPVFVDTSGWIALLNADDRFHPHATQSLRDLATEARPLVTTDWVLAETGNGLARIAARERFVLASVTPSRWIAISSRRGSVA